MTAPALAAITTPQNNGSNTLAVNMPGSVVATDLLICILSHGGTNVNMPGTNPWTKKIENSNNICVAYIRGTDHIANGSPGTYSFTTGGVSAITNAYVIRLTGVIATGDPFDALITGASTASGSSGSCTITTTVADVYLHNADFKSAARTLNVAPTGMTQRAGGAGNSFQHAFDAMQAVAGSTGAKVSTYTVNSSHSSVLFAVKPVAVAETTGTASGTCTVSGVGGKILGAVGSASGSCTVSGTGAATRGATGSAGGSSTVVGSGAARDATTGSASGSSTASGVATQTDSTTGGAAGTSSAIGVSSTVKPATGSASGSSSASGVGALTVDIIGNAAGTSSVNGMASDTATFTGSAAGTSSATGVAGGVASTTGNAAGTSSAQAQATKVISTTGHVVIGCLEDWPDNDEALTISGHVYYHEPPNQGDPVDGASVVLIRDLDGFVVGSELTDVDGLYSFPRGTTDPYTYHVEVRYADQQGLSEGGCSPS